MIQNFTDSLNVGKIGEILTANFLKQYYENVGLDVTVELIPFNERKDLQKAGIDIILTVDGLKTTIDAKTQKFEYSNYDTFLFETYYHYEGKKEGWLYKAKCDYFYYGWLSPDKKSLIKLYSVDRLKLIEALETNRINIERKIYGETHGFYEDYHSECISIKIENLIKVGITEQLI